MLGHVQTTVIPNGIDPDRFANLPTGVVEKRGPTVLSVGAVKLRKGTLEMVQSMAKVCEVVPNAQCVIIGSIKKTSGYFEQVRAEISRLGLENHVHLLGHVPEETLLAWYGAADVFALPSMNVGRKFEGYGLVHMEASAAGLPVIGTTDCGAEDAIEDGVTGLLVPQSAVTDTLPGAIITLLTNPQRAAQMGAAGQSRARQYTWVNMARRMIGFYEKQFD
jgi:phosphatidylinositol alpha-1,6-mannosyltransferase